MTASKKLSVTDGTKGQEGKEGLETSDTALSEHLKSKSFLLGHCWRAVAQSSYYPRQKSWPVIYFWYLDLPKPESAPHCQESNIKTGTL